MANQVDEESSSEDKKKQITPLLLKSMSKGQTWYLISKEWWRKFQLYIGLSSEEVDDRAALFPGHIDNSSILNENGSLKLNLLDKTDYELVPSEAWELLVKWFGKVPGQDPLKRKVVELGESKQPMVEVYLVPVKVCKNFDPDTFVNLYFSSNDTVAKLKRDIKREFDIPETTPTKLWHIIVPGVPGQCEGLDKLDKTVQEVGINHGQTLVIGTPNAKGAWSTVKYSDYGHQNVGGGDMRRAQPGICGLCNLGNTCFMNSVLQCMSNCPPITEYFLNGEHHRELNKTNPLGMEGEIAMAYGDLIQNMWSGKYPSLTPHQFKLQVGRFAPQFCGYQQHDSQELLTFLLDGLHEDLNRIKQKPYIEKQDTDNLPDEEFAKISWENYLKRNDSVIVDFFHGLLKSTVVCPDCNKISVTFDPFCYLSLPLPQKKERIIEVVLVPDDSMKKALRYRLPVPKKGFVRDICRALREYTNIPEDKMFVTNVVRNHFHSVLSMESPIWVIGERDVIYIYELPISHTQNEGNVVRVCLSESDPEVGRNKLFGIPFVIIVPNGKCSYVFLYRTILNRLRRYLRVLESRDTTLVDDMNISNGSYSLFEDPSCDVDDENKKPFFLFSIHLLSNTSDQTTELEPNGKPLDFSNFQFGQYLTIQWTPKNKELYFEDLCEPEIGRQDSLRHLQTGNLQLKDCLELFTTTEKLGVDDEWYCPQCKKHQRATKKFDIWALPRILIIHLKRFSYNRCRRDKLDVLIDFPIQGLDMTEYVINQSETPAVYDLFAVCNHYGAMGGGHYTAYAKNKLDNKWHCFDDKSVTYTGKYLEVSSAAYVLFYQRRDPNVL